MLKFLVVCAYSAVVWQTVVAELEGQTERPWHTTVQPAQDTLFHSNFFPARPNQVSVLHMLPDLFDTIKILK